MPADFHEVRLDFSYSFNATGGPRFKTNILDLNSGHEKRNQQWTKIRSEFEIFYTVQFKSEADPLKDFFFARRGRAFGFRFRDAQDFTMERQNIGTTDGSTAIFQIFKRYPDSINPYDRDLVKIVEDSYVNVVTPLVVRVNTVIIDEGAAADEFQIDRNTGLITLGATHAATSGELLELECEFDVPVRFNIDDWPSTITDVNNFEIGPLPIVEVRDIT